MDLILWRHAEAQEWTQGCDDMARRLTSRGEKQAARMAGWLDRQLPDNTRILVSPARRTEQTASALGRKFKIRPELARMARWRSCWNWCNGQMPGDACWWWGINPPWGKPLPN